MKPRNVHGRQQKLTFAFFLNCRVIDKMSLFVKMMTGNQSGWCRLRLNVNQVLAQRGAAIEDDRRWCLKIIVSSKKDRQLQIRGETSKWFDE